MPLLPTPDVGGGGKAVPDDAKWSGKAAYKPDGTKVQVNTENAVLRLLKIPTASDANGAGRPPGRTGGDDLRTQIALLPTPRASDGAKGGPNQRGSKGDLALPSAVQADRWGEYGPAVRRWEPILGRPAPSPTEPGKSGKPRLSPRFVEWMMGLPDGWVTDVGVSTNAQIKALGNGVVPQQAVAALHVLSARLGERAA